MLTEDFHAHEDGAQNAGGDELVARRDVALRPRQSVAVLHTVTATVTATAVSVTVGSLQGANHRSHRMHVEPIASCSAIMSVPFRSATCLFMPNELII